MGRDPGAAQNAGAAERANTASPDVMMSGNAIESQPSPAEWRTGDAFRRTIDLAMAAPISRQWERAQR